MQEEKMIERQKIRHKYEQVRQLVEKKFSIEETPNTENLAKTLGLPPSSAKRWQSSGKYKPEEAETLRKIVGINRDWLLFDEGGPLDSPADELERLRVENAALRAELEQLKA